MKTSAHYDDPKFSYVQYWNNRSYEHAAEELALKHLLSNFSCQTAVDMGGGYGRLSQLLTHYSKHVILVEPSQKQLDIAKKLLSKTVTLVRATSEKSTLPSASADLIIMIRVSHHLPDLLPTIRELHRVLKPNGKLIIEIANSIHLKAKILSWIHGIHISHIPVERRSLTNIRRNTIDFVNHHPQHTLKLLLQHGFVKEKTLSVSNFRSEFLKKILPLKILLVLEKLVQNLGANMYLGPSIFILLHKNIHTFDKPTTP